MRPIAKQGTQKDAGTNRRFWQTHVKPLAKKDIAALIRKVVDEGKALL